MSNVILCQGAYAKTPYYAADDCRNLYSIEELCYYLYHNAYLLDDSFVTSELSVWIAEELELPELGKEVNKLVGRAEALAKLVATLSNNIGYYEEEEWLELLQDIGRNNKLTIEERRKIRADGFLDEGKYALAMDEYAVIIRETSVSQVKLRAKVYHNMGVAAARLFMFELAADYFGKAYENFANTESYVSMLCAMKMYMSQAEYLDYLSKHQESYEDSLEVERKCEFLKLDWSRQPARMFFSEILELKKEGKAYYDGIISMAEEVKDEYRDCMFRHKAM